MIRLIVKEDVETDKYYRDKALEVYRNLESFLEDSADSLRERMEMYGDLPRGSMFRTNNEGGFDFLYGQYFGDTNLVFRFLPQDERVTGFGRAKDGVPVIVLSFLQGTYDLTAIEIRITGEKPNIVHEVIHYLDEERGEQRGGSAKKFDSGEVADYYNTPEEFNAYYQEAAFEVERLIDSLPDKFKKKWLASFDKFLNTAYGQLSKAFVENLNSKYERKLKKRLYNLYLYLIDKYNLPY